MMHAHAGSPQMDHMVVKILNDVSHGARHATYPANAVICEPEMPADDVYLIETGEVRIYQVSDSSTDRLLDIVGKGQWFGSAALAGLERHFFRAVTMTPVTLWATPGKKVRDAMCEEPQALIEVLRHIVLLLANTAREATQMATDDCRHRLVHTLVKFSQSAAATNVENGVVLRITHEQLAQAVGAARETVSLALTELRQAKLLQTGRNRLTFNPKALEEFAQRQANLNPVDVAEGQTPMNEPTPK